MFSIKTPLYYKDLVFNILSQWERKQCFKGLSTWYQLFLSVLLPSQLNKSWGFEVIFKGEFNNYSHSSSASCFKPKN